MLVTHAPATPAQLLDRTPDLCPLAARHAASVDAEARFPAETIDGARDRHPRAVTPPPTRSW